MGKIIASCGHELKENEGENGLGNCINIKSFSRENEPAVDYMCVCDKCYDMYKFMGDILKDEEIKEYLAENII